MCCKTSTIFSYGQELYFIGGFCQIRTAILAVYHFGIYHVLWFGTLFGLARGLLLYSIMKSTLKKILEQRARTCRELLAASPRHRGDAVVRRRLARTLARLARM